MLPTAYIIISNNYGLNNFIINIAEQNSIPFSRDMPLSIEYIVFTIFFTLMLLIIYGFKGSTTFSLPLFFLGLVGIIYTIDNLYPYGAFSPFQIFVPATAHLAKGVLNFLGYQTRILSIENNLPTLIACSPTRCSNVFSIAWPCSGIESLIIYSITILLFLKRTILPLKEKISYFIIGAIITYLINILRIVSIFIISINGGDYLLFHNFYGQLYSIIWITCYPLIIIGSQFFLNKIIYSKTNLVPTS